MTVAKYEAMNLNELRRYVLTHREDVAAFHMYIDRSKSEGRMITIDLNDQNWEDKVKEAIKYSSNAIRWYCNNTPKYTKEVQIISEWWNQLDNKFVTKHHISGIEIEQATGIWEPIQINPPVQIRISEPSLEIGESTTLLKYRSQDNSINKIEAVAIDLDIAKQNLFVWPTQAAEVFIFSTEVT
ncbi:MAG: hypothetical protein V7L29_18945 [Nostoc sp.]|uniref:DUF6887 family protein n=1 Tax=Nostoc sp. TaxID=1180 RepID=UPI002FF9A0D4